MTESQKPREHIEPKATRSYLPDYSPLDARSGRELLPWSWVTERIGQAHNYWLATTQSNGQPHMTPVWGVWLGDVFYFSAGPVRARQAISQSMVFSKSGSGRSKQKKFLRAVPGKRTSGLSGIGEVGLVDEGYHEIVDPSHNGSGVSYSHPSRIFVEGHIARTMQTGFDVPMFQWARRRCKRRLGEAF